MPPLCAAPPPSLPKADSGSPYQDVTMKCALIHMLGALALTASAWDDIIKSFALTNAPKKAAPVVPCR